VKANALCEPGAARTQETLKRDGRAKQQAASSKRQAAKKDLTGPVKYEMIPYNL